MNRIETRQTRKPITREVVPPPYSSGPIMVVIGEEVITRTLPADRDITAAERYRHKEEGRGRVDTSQIKSRRDIGNPVEARLNAVRNLIATIDTIAELGQ